MFEKKKNQFNLIHTDLPDLLSKKSKKYNIEKFIHISALGIENSIDSNYASSKLEGERKIIKNFENHIIIKPSIVYSVDDKFTTTFMSLLSMLPVIPIYYNGNTKFAPIHVTDLVDIIHNLIESKTKRIVLECVGPEELTFKEILKNLLKAIGKKRLLLPLPLPSKNFG